MKKRQREVRLMRAGIQLAFFIAAPSLFSTAFAGINQSSCHWIRTGGGVEFFFDRDGRSSDLHLSFSEDISVDMRVRSDLRRCRVRSFSWIWTKCFHKKETSLLKAGPQTSESQIYRTGPDPAFLHHRCIRKAHRNHARGMFFHDHSWTASKQ